MDDICDQKNDISQVWFRFKSKKSINKKTDKCIFYQVNAHKKLEYLGTLKC
jgi:hypothetical protein